MHGCFGWFDFLPLFLGRLISEWFTSNQMVSQYRISFAKRHKQPIYFFRPQWAGARKESFIQLYGKVFFNTANKPLNA